MMLPMYIGDGGLLLKFGLSCKRLRLRSRESEKCNSLKKCNSVIVLLCETVGSFNYFSPFFR